MTIEFTLPDIGEGLHEAEIVTWLVAEGQRIERNQPFVEIMTDKSNVEMPAPAAGVVARLGPAEGDVVQVGDLLIVIDDGGETGAVTAPDDVARSSDPVPAEAFGHVAAPTDGKGIHPLASGVVHRRAKASPSTRRLAAELDVDLSAVAGTGPGGRVLADDVRAHHRVEATPPDGPLHATGRAALTPSPGGVAPAAGGSSGSELGWMEVGVHPLRGIRRATAQAMDRSWSTIPHISASNELDATALLAARRQLVELQGADGPPLTPLVLVVMAVARALRRFPMMNASLDLEAESITVPESVNIGIAVATEHGLIVPVVANADRLGVVALAAEIARLSAAARNRSVTPGELGGGTHTVTNYGTGGTHLAAPIIRPGEGAITGLGAIAERPIVVDGEVVARPTLPVVVCGDHRLVDGDVMSAYHREVCRTLAAPIGLLL